MNKLLLVAGLMLTAVTASADFTPSFDFPSFGGMENHAKAVIAQDAGVKAYARALGGSLASVDEVNPTVYSVETSNGCAFNVNLAYKGPWLKGVSVVKNAECR